MWNISLFADAVRLKHYLLQVIWPLCSSKCALSAAGSLLHRKEIKSLISVPTGKSEL